MQIFACCSSIVSPRLFLGFKSTSRDYANQLPLAILIQVEAIAAGDIPNRTWHQETELNPIGPGGKNVPNDRLRGFGTLVT